MQLLFIAVVLAVLGYAFLNGMHDSSGLVAAAISSRSMKPRSALCLAAAAEFVGPFLFGTAVAATIGKDLVESSAITLPVLLIAICSAIIWNLATWYLGLPSSSTHALLGGLVGAVTLMRGPQYLLLGGFVKVLFALFLAPFVGLVAGYLFMLVTKKLTCAASPQINSWFKHAQPFNVIALAVSHGTDDGQKSMGLLAIALVAAGYQTDFGVPLWVTLIVAIALMLGVSSGGWRIIRTIGGGIYRLRPVHAFATQTSSAAIVMVAALLGAPISTTQVVSAAIIGVGSAERASAVRWQVAGQIAKAWLITVPAAAAVAAVLAIVPFGWAIATVEKVLGV
ncbi:MAG TPA: anion permease [Anaerolineae bacterium]